MKFASTALAIGVIAMAGTGFAASVTVHSDGTSGDYATIGQALAAVQGESAGPGHPDVITILNEGPFRQGALTITGDAHANDITIRAAEGVRPILVSTHTGASAIEIRKNGKVELRDLIIIPAANISQTATRAILCDVLPTGSTGYDITLENILITSNNGNDRPIASEDGLGNPFFNAQLHASFRGDGGIRVNSTDEQNVYRTSLKRVVVSCIESSAPFGLRSFQDGSAGSELIVGEGCVFSRIRSTTSSGAAVNFGGMEGAPNIGRVLGSEDSPVLIVNNQVVGLYLTGTNAESNMIRNAIITGNTSDGVFLVNPQMSTSLINVTVANNSSYAIRFTQNNGSALNLAGSISVVDSIIAGNGATAFSNSIYGSLASTGSLSFTDSAVVRFGLHRLNPALVNGMSISGTGSVSMTRVIATDPAFVSLSLLNPGFARVAAVDYATAGSGGTPLRGGGKYGSLPVTQQQAGWYHYN